MSQDKQDPKDSNANTITSPPVYKIALVYLLGWLVPGAGHIPGGSPRRALAYFLTIVSTFCIGIAITDANTISLDQHPWYFLMQICGGLPPLAVWISHLGAALPNTVTPYTDIGFLFTSVAGLLNILVIFHAHDLLCEKYANMQSQTKEKTGA